MLSLRHWNWPWSLKTKKCFYNFRQSLLLSETRTQVTLPLVSCSSARPKGIYFMHKNGVYVQALCHDSSANNNKYTLPQGRRRWRRCMRRRNVRCWRCVRAWQFVARIFKRFFNKIVIWNHCLTNSVINNSNNSNNPKNSNKKHFLLSFQTLTII